MRAVPPASGALAASPSLLLLRLPLLLRRRLLSPPPCDCASASACLSGFLLRISSLLCETRSSMKEPLRVRGMRARRRLNDLLARALRSRASCLRFFGNPMATAAAAACPASLLWRGLPAILLRSECGSLSSVVLLHGATVVKITQRPHAHSAVDGSEEDAGDHEVLFVSRMERPQPSAPVRGGVPVVFPQFGQPNAHMPSHGVARTAAWSVAHADDSEAAACFADLPEFRQACSGGAAAVLELRDSEETRAMWPHAFHLRLLVHVRSQQVDMRLHASATGDAGWAAQALLHTYLRVSPPQAPRAARLAAEAAAVFDSGSERLGPPLPARVAGLADRSFIDKLAPATAERPRQQGRDLIIESEVDRIFAQLLDGSSDAGVTVSVAPDESDGCDARGDRRICVSARAWLEERGRTARRVLPVDVVVWNPWVAKARRLADLADDEFAEMLCIEPGLVAEAVHVPAGGAMVLEQTISVL